MNGVFFVMIEKSTLRARYSSDTPFLDTDGQFYRSLRVLDSEKRDCFFICLEKKLIIRKYIEVHKT